MQGNIKKKLQLFYNLAEKIYSAFFHIIFLEACKSYGFVPKGLKIKKQPCIGRQSSNFSVNWKNEIKRTEENLRDILLNENVVNLFWLESCFWDKIDVSIMEEKWLLRLNTWKSSKKNY